MNPLTYDRRRTSPAWSPSCRSGRPDARPCRERPAAPGRLVPDLTATDVVLVWGGGIYAWFDPETLLRAVARLAPDVPRLRLLFLGTAPPRARRATAASAARDLAAELGAGTGERSASPTAGFPTTSGTAWLTAADIGVSTHHAARRDRVLLPDADRGLPVVRPAGRHHRWRRAGRAGQRSGVRARRCRRRRRRAGRCAAHRWPTTPPVRAATGSRAAQRGGRARLVAGGRAAGRLLRCPAASSGPGARRGRPRAAGGRRREDIRAESVAPGMAAVREGGARLLLRRLGARRATGRLAAGADQAAGRPAADRLRAARSAGSRRANDASNPQPELTGRRLLRDDARGSRAGAPPASRGDRKRERRGHRRPAVGRSAQHEQAVALVEEANWSPSPGRRWPNAGGGPRPRARTGSSSPPDAAARRDRCPRSTGRSAGRSRRPGAPRRCAAGPRRR